MSTEVQEWPAVCLIVRLLPPSLLVYTVICVQVSSMCVCPCRSQKLTLGIVTQSLCTLFLKTEFIVVPELQVDQAAWTTDFGNQSIYLLHSGALKAPSTTLQALGLKLRASCLPGKHFTNEATFLTRASCLFLGGHWSPSPFASFWPLKRSNGHQA